jgi:6-pyruvoyltetrahydropterin/6-carboxytetrahydropterin synthase
MEIFKEFTIEAAHWLPNVPEGHKCRRLHGHSFHIAIHVSGPLDPQLGWVMDFAEIKAAFKGHRGPDRPPLPERGQRPGESHQRKSGPLAVDGTAAGAALLSKIVVKETCTSGCVYAPRRRRSVS